MESNLLSLGKKNVVLCGGWSFECWLAVSNSKVELTVQAWDLKRVAMFINDMKEYFLYADRAVEGEFRFALLPDALARISTCRDE
jgi:hypothetical protein